MTRTPLQRCRVSENSTLVPIAITRISTFDRILAHVKRDLFPERSTLNYPTVFDDRVVVPTVLVRNNREQWVATQVRLAFQIELPPFPLFTRYSSSARWRLVNLSLVVVRNSSGETCQTPLGEPYSTSRHWKFGVDIPYSIETEVYLKVSLMEYLGLWALYGETSVPGTIARVLDARRR